MTRFAWVWKPQKKCPFIAVTAAGGARMQEGILSLMQMPRTTVAINRMRAAGLGDTPVIVGGIIPDDDAENLRAMGVARVYTPKDFELNTIMADIVTLADPEAVAAE